MHEESVDIGIILSVTFFSYIVYLKILRFAQDDKRTQDDKSVRKIQKSV